MQPRQPTRHEVASDVVVNHDTMSRRLLMRVLIVLLIVLSLAGLSWFGIRAVATITADHNVNSKEYQAIFLSNGQVYFGKLSKVNAKYVSVTKIFYLQVSTNGSQSTVQPSTSSTSGQQVSLAKLGGELHGPEDAMYINRDQILFWENLKDSGKVTQAINTYYNANK